MKLRFERWVRKSLSLAQAIGLNGQWYQRRELVFCAYRDESGFLHWGELATLESVHPESLSIAIAALEQFIAAHPYLDMPDIDSQVTADPFVAMQELSSANAMGLSSVRSCIQQIYWSYWYRYTHDGGRGRRLSLRQVGLLQLADSDLERQVASYADRGYRTVKVKIGRLSYIDEIRSLNKLCLSKCDLKLRLDANAALSPQELTRYCQALRELPVEFVEEPFQTESQWNEWQDSWPLARDESLWDRSWEPNQLRGFYLVYKPARMGIKALWQWIHSGMIAPESIILSSCYESGLANLYYLQLAEYLGLSADHGFGTYQYLSEDVLESPLFTAAGEQECSLYFDDWELKL